MQLRTDKEIDPEKVVANRTNAAEQYNEIFLNDNELEELWQHSILENLARI